MDVHKQTDKLPVSTQKAHMVTDGHQAYTLSSALSKIRVLALGLGYTGWQRRQLNIEY